MIGNKNYQKVFTEVPDLSLQSAKLIFSTLFPSSPEAKVSCKILENYYGS
jgi:hypothetical protein